MTRKQSKPETVCEYCASNGERGIKAGGDCIMCGVGRTAEPWTPKPETPRIVAECWTCGVGACTRCGSRRREQYAWEQRDGGGYIGCRPESSDPWMKPFHDWHNPINWHRAAGHDVRPVKEVK